MMEMLKRFEESSLEDEEDDGEEDEFAERVGAVDLGVFPVYRHHDLV